MIDEESHKETVDHRNDGGLRRGKHAAVDSPEDDDRHQQGPEGIHKGIIPQSLFEETMVIPDKTLPAPADVK